MKIYDGKTSVKNMGCCDYSSGDSIVSPSSSEATVLKLHREDEIHSYCYYTSIIYT